MIREQFDWVVQHERRMLVIDEIAAVARSRRLMDNMHSDEMANVNELLVQKDHEDKPIHVVWGILRYAASPAVVVTAYRPDSELWTADFMRRKS